MSTEAEIIEAQRRVFERPSSRGERHLMGPEQVRMLFEALRRNRCVELHTENERLLKLTADLTDALRSRGDELDRACGRIAELKDHVMVWEKEAKRLRLFCAAHPDTLRLNRLDTMRRNYSRPPMRAVTGWEWSIVDESGAKDVRAALDAKGALVAKEVAP